MDMKKINCLFDGWEETMITTCLQGHMGGILTDEEENPKSAQAYVGDFCFFVGRPNEELVTQAKADILVSQSPAWETMIEKIWGNRVFSAKRYAIKKEGDVFNRAKLNQFVDAIAPDYELKSIDKEIYACCMAEDWSRDLCAQFKDYKDYKNRGIGIAALKDGIPAAGASSYTIYSGGIEIEIDTQEAHRRKGLATACGAALILACLEKGIYPSWDAHDLRSVALAEKLGYHRDKEYTVYIKR